LKRYRLIKHHRSAKYEDQKKKDGGNQVVVLQKAIHFGLRETYQFFEALGKKEISEKRGGRRGPWGGNSGKLRQNSKEDFRILCKGTQGGRWGVILQSMGRNLLFLSLLEQC